jgi:hypothetical protein
MSLWSWLVDKFGAKPIGKPVQVPSGALETGLREGAERKQREFERRHGPTISLQVDYFAGFKVEVYAKEHPPPHFHVRCAGGKASFRISDCNMLNGDLAADDRIIKKWHAKNKSKIIRAWNESRPTDCSVGKYREN